jgi:threonine aldolase
VGDDVFGEDPTTARLENSVAELLGKEAALFVSSGVMGNQLAIRSQTEPGDAVLVEAEAHIAFYESGAPGALSGVVLERIPGERGAIQPHQVNDAVWHGYDWEAKTSLLCLENTHNRAGGAVFPLEQIQAVCEAARARELHTHLDGARLWNASVATGIPEFVYAETFDTVSVCLSKGLGAPIGSVLAGPESVILRARRFRKLFGGGMRQTGHMAAAGLVALERNRDRLADDHRRARKLAEAMSQLSAIHLDPATVETNILMFDTVGMTAAEFVNRLANYDVLTIPFGPHTVRAITHLDVTDSQIEYTVHVLRELFA